MVVNFTAIFFAMTLLIAESNPKDNDINPPPKNHHSSIFCPKTNVMFKRFSNLDYTFRIKL
jgi:hypothetical protein